MANNYFLLLKRQVDVRTVYCSRQVVKHVESNILCQLLTCPLTFALLLTYRQEVDWINYFNSGHPNRVHNDRQDKWLDIETTRNFETVLF